MKEAPRHAPLAKLSAEPGTIDKVMNTVAHAKKEIELKKQSAKKAAENAAQLSQQELELEKENSDGGDGDGAALASAALESKEEAEKEAEGIVSSAVGAVKTTATDIQDFLGRLKHLIDQGAIEGPPPDAGSGIWVHSGFLNAYDSVRGAVLGLIDAALTNSSSLAQENTISVAAKQQEEELEKDAAASKTTFRDSDLAENSTNNNNTTSHKALEEETEEETPGWTVLFTGHSLGGALATLAAFDLSHRSSSSKNKPEKIAMYNFGSPRVGNKAFATEFNRAVPESWRLVAQNDAVVRVPRLVGYCHVGHAVIVGLDPETHDRKIEVQLNSSEAPFEGVAVVDEVLPVVGAAIKGAVTRAVPAVIKGVGLEVAAAAESDGTHTSSEQGEKETTAKLTSEQLAEYWELEKEAWAGLFQGTAISEHMEEFYYKGIEDAVDEWRQQRRTREAKEDKIMKENQQENSNSSNGGSAAKEK
jgi:hypothetical protein